jgi:hypothetical protein
MLRRLLGRREGSFHVVRAVLGRVGGPHKFVHDLAGGLDMVLAADSAWERAADGWGVGTTIIVSESEALLWEEGQTAVTAPFAPEQECAN